MTILRDTHASVKVGAVNFSVSSLPSGSAWIVKASNDVRSHMVDHYHGEARCDCSFDQSAECEHARVVRMMRNGTPAVEPQAVVEEVPCCSPAEAAPCEACVTEAAAYQAIADVFAFDPDAESDPAEWPDWTDADTWELSEPFDDDASERLTLAELVERERSRFLSWGNDLGTLLASRLGDLAEEVRILGARTPAEFYDHAEILARDYAPALNVSA